MKTNLICILMLLLLNVNSYSQIDSATVEAPDASREIEDLKKELFSKTREIANISSELSKSKIQVDYYRSLENKSMESPFSKGSELNLSEFKSDTASVKKPSSLPNARKDMTSMITVIKKLDSNSKAGAEVPGFGGLKFEKDESNLNAYHIETKVVGGKVYAIGYSVHYLFKKIKKGLSLSNMAAICASVTLDSGKTEVYYSIRTYGMSGKPLTKFFKPVINKPFDVEGYAIMQSSIDGIHAIMGDETLGEQITYTPQEISFIKPADLKN